MRDLFSRAAARQQARLNDHASVAVVYSRKRVLADGEQPPAESGDITVSAPDANGDVIVSIATSAAVGRTPFTQQTDGEQVVSDEARDYLIEASKLDVFWTVAAGKAEPMSGDEVRQVIGSQTVVFTAMPAGGEPVFSRPSDVQLRVHTKRTGLDE